MRLATLRTSQGPRACARWEDHYVDLHAADGSLPLSIKEILALGPDGLARAAAAAKKGSVRYDPKAATFLAPVPDPQKVLCLGLNYADHAAESGMDPPAEPVLFSKFSSALIGHGDEIVLPKVSSEVDYEAELIVVIGKHGRDVPKDQAMSFVGGYAVGHDVSARDWQLNKSGKQWLAGKTFDTFGPIGPDLVTADEIDDPHKLGIRLRLNGRTMQDSNTSQLIFKIDEIIAYISQVFTLEPGDVIFTGTPPGVGMARKPPIWLQPGDVVEVEIDGLGTLRNPIVRH